MSLSKNNSKDLTSISNLLVTLTELVLNCSSSHYQQSQMVLVGYWHPETEKAKWQWEMKIATDTSNKFLLPQSLLLFLSSQDATLLLCPYRVSESPVDYRVVSYSNRSCTRASSLYCSRGGVKEESMARIALRILRSRTWRSQAG